MAGPAGAASSEIETCRSADHTRGYLAPVSTEASSHLEASATETRSRRVRPLLIARFFLKIVILCQSRKKIRAT